MKDHRLKPRKQTGIKKTLPLNFLLGCGQSIIENFELARLQDVADLRKELHVILDRVIDAMSQATLASWFRTQDRQALKHAIENEESPIEWADRMIRDGQRSEDELIPALHLEPGQAHRTAAMTYQKRNIAEGKCHNCPEPLAPGSVRYCEKHLAAERNRHKPKDETPGSIDYLYQDHSPESRHGRQPGTLASLAMSREKRTRALLADLGVSPQNAAVSLNAAKEALLAHMPTADSESGPMTADDLFALATVPSRTTGRKALNELLAEGKIQRTGQGGNADVFRYFMDSAETPKPKRKPSRAKQNSTLLQTLRGEK